MSSRSIIGFAVTRPVGLLFRIRIYEGADHTLVRHPPFPCCALEWSTPRRERPSVLGFHS